MPLSRDLDALIEQRANSSGQTKEEVYEAAGRAAGISASTVKQIANGQIECPPFDRLRDLERFLRVGSRLLVGSAERDGCAYGDNM